ncbi:MAG: EFR1 family ferrodoxin [Candidatus Methanomethylophilaceae archaeon]|nr:EFR1 family ferrodoxin [Candidatus Methanomethylophilaceae archaeon]
MIFIFSGTGNSYHVAKRISTSAESDMVDMAAAVRYKRSFYNADGKSVGFVFPVYFHGLPSVVEEFLETVEIVKPGYVYAVSTCAGESGKACEQLQDILGKKLKVDAYYDVLMPENAVFYEDVPDKEEAKKINEKADATIDNIISSIGKEERGDFRTMAGSECFEQMRKDYAAFRNTEPFSVDERCIECRMCEHVCPEQIIKVYHRKPVWDELQCSMCMCCLNMCPKEALQFADLTQKRGRYFHPDYYMWSLGVNPPLKYEDFKKYDSGLRY